MHFTLIIVAITGIIVGRSSDVTELRIAQQQLRGLAGFLTKDLPLNLNLRLQRLNWLVFEANGKKYAAPPVEDSYYVIDGETCPVPFTPATSSISVDDFGTALKQVPTLTDFKAFWNFLECANIRAYEIAAAGDAFIMADSVRVPFTAKQLTAEEQRSYTFVDFRFHHDSFTSLVDYGKKADSLQIKFVTRIQVAEGTVVGFSGYSGLEPAPSNVELVMPLKVFEVPHKELARLAGVQPKPRNYLWYWSGGQAAGCRGQFELCFPELNSIELQKPYTGWSELGAWLDNEIVRAESKQFTFLGIKPPPAEESYWGALVIIAVLFYLFTYLRQLNLQAEPDQAALDVAWVGSYSSFPAYVAVWLTVFVLPLVGVLFLAVRGIHLHFDSWTRTQDIPARFLYLQLPSVFVCIALSLSCCLRMMLLADIATGTREKLEKDNRGVCASPEQTQAEQTPKQN